MHCFPLYLCVDDVDVDSIPTRGELCHLSHLVTLHSNAGLGQFSENHEARLLITLFCLIYNILQNDYLPNQDRANTQPEDKPEPEWGEDFQKSSFTFCFSLMVGVAASRAVSRVWLPSCVSQLCFLDVKLWCQTMVTKLVESGAPAVWIQGANRDGFLMHFHHW